MVIFFFSFCFTLADLEAAHILKAMSTSSPLKPLKKRVFSSSYEKAFKKRKHSIDLMEVQHGFHLPSFTGTTSVSTSTPAYHNVQTSVENGFINSRRIVTPVMHTTESVKHIQNKDTAIDLLSTVTSQGLKQRGRLIESTIDSSATSPSLAPLQMEPIRERRCYSEDSTVAPRRLSSSSTSSTSSSLSSSSASQQRRYSKRDAAEKHVRPLGPPPPLHHFNNFNLNEMSLRTLSVLSQNAYKNNTHHLLSTELSQSNSITPTATFSDVNLSNVNNIVNTSIATKAYHDIITKQQIQGGLAPVISRNTSSDDDDPVRLHPNLLPMTSQLSEYISTNGNPMLCFQTNENATSLPKMSKIGQQTCISLDKDSFFSSSAYKVCKMEGCGTRADKRSPYCKNHRGQRKCENKECNKFAQSKTRYCIKHGGGRRCKFPNCNKGARDKFFCGAHGGGKRCTIANCRKLAVGGDKVCTAHGGGRRCQSMGCTKSAQSSSNFCVKHGGGRKCKMDYCEKVARGKLGFCMSHANATNEIHNN